MSKQYDSYSENPRWVLYRGRGDKLRCGEFLYYQEGGRMKVLTAPGTSVPTTSIKESSSLTPQELCRQHNLLVQALEEMHAERGGFVSKRQPFRKVERMRYISIGAHPILEGAQGYMPIDVLECGHELPAKLLLSPSKTPYVNDEEGERWRKCKKCPREESA